ncbi:hypothetical protein GGE67_000771 [Rhizobium leucaenae]|nr:hypothetical protein [Rhizobium leucaenae]
MVAKLIPAFTQEGSLAFTIACAPHIAVSGDVTADFGKSAKAHSALLFPLVAFGIPF